MACAGNPGQRACPVRFRPQMHRVPHRTHGTSPNRGRVRHCKCDIPPNRCRTAHVECGVSPKQRHVPPEAGRAPHRKREVPPEKCDVPPNPSGAWHSQHDASRKTGGVPHPACSASHSRRGAPVKKGRTSPKTRGASHQKRDVPPKWRDRPHKKRHDRRGVRYARIVGGTEGDHAATHHRNRCPRRARRPHPIPGCRPRWSRRTSNWTRPRTPPVSPLKKPQAARYRNSAPTPMRGLPVRTPSGADQPAAVATANKPRRSRPGRRTGSASDRPCETRAVRGHAAAGRWRWLASAYR